MSKYLLLEIINFLNYFEVTKYRTLNKRINSLVDTDEEFLIVQEH